MSLLQGILATWRAKSQTGREKGSYFEELITVIKRRTAEELRYGAAKGRQEKIPCCQVLRYTTCVNTCPDVDLRNDAPERFPHPCPD